jgi:plasmid stability protein
VTLTIDLPDNLEAALRAQANAQGLSEAGYVRNILERDLAQAGSSPHQNLAQFLMESPFAGSDLSLERQHDHGRKVDL